MTDEEFFDKEEAISILRSMKFGTCLNDRCLRGELFKATQKMSDSMLRKCVETFIKELEKHQ